MQAKKEAKDLTISEAMGYEEKRRSLIDGITGIAEKNRHDGRSADPGDAGREPGARWRPARRQLKGTEAAGMVAATLARRDRRPAAVEMEARDTTSAAGSRR